MSPIDKYLKDVTPSQKEALERVRKIIKQTVPEAEETISWTMPTFKYNKKNLIHFAAFKNHMSIFPGSALVKDVRDKLKDYTLSKGTIQFTEDHPLPESIIKEILAKRLADISQN